LIIFIPQEKFLFSFFSAGHFFGAFDTLEIFLWNLDELEDFFLPEEEFLLSSFFSLSSSSDKAVFGDHFLK